MKKILSFCLLFCVITSLFSQNNFSFTPSGTVHVYDNIYMDKTEVANIDWLEYLHYLRIDSTHQYLKEAIPDTVSLSYFKKYSINYRLYLTHPAFRYFPVTNISYEQAINYGRWRSLAMEMIVNQHPVENGLESNQRVKLNYRLPTEKEWEIVARDGLDLLDFPYGLKNINIPFENKIKAKKSYRSINQDTMSFSLFKQMFKKNKLTNDLVFNTIKSFGGLFEYGNYFPQNTNGSESTANNKGIVHLIGNVSEMIHEQGIAKGGSYLDHIDDISIKSRWLYSRPSIILGVRYICELEIIEIEE